MERNELLRLRQFGNSEGVCIPGENMKRGRALVVSAPREGALGPELGASVF